VKKKEFHTILKSITTDGMVDLDKVALLTNEVRAKMVHYIVRYRGPVIKALIPPDFDLPWLHSMGYLYETKGSFYTFIHPIDLKIK
jgi:hypothetical protein